MLSFIFAFFFFVRWAFNTSTKIVDTTWFKGHTGQEVSYTPRSDLDFGSLLCWASNEVGKQNEPCVIHVINAGKATFLKQIIVFQKAFTLRVSASNFIRTKP